MIKLFITDIDHTVYSSILGEIPEENIVAMKKMIDRGITIALATSRIYNGLISTAELLNLKDHLSYGVGFNGAYTLRYNDGKVLTNEVFADEDVDYVIRTAAENNIGAVVYQDDRYITNRWSNINEYNFVHVESDIILTHDIRKHLTDPVHQMMLSDDNADMYELAKVFDEKTGHRYNINCAQPICMDFSPKGVSKLSALEAIIKDMGITMDEVAALGDGDNDAPMLKAAGISGCVGNGSVLAKASADYILKDCKDGGAAQFINEFILKD